jgi:hypothetical protein
MADNDVIKIASGHQTVGPLLTADELAAVQGAASPSGANPFTTGIKTVTRTLTSAEIKALYTTPITLVAGVADTVYAFVGAWAVFRAGATAYSTNGGNLRIGSSISYDSGLASSSFIDQAVDQFLFWSPITNPSALNLSAAAGDPLSVNLDTANPTLGDGTIDLTVLYYVLDVS